MANKKHAAYLNNEELAGLSVGHNLDLYNDTQVEKFVRRVAEKLETGSIEYKSDGLYNQISRHRIPLQVYSKSFLNVGCKNVS
ncbi:hypothetical protein QEG73_00030 [Chitinophagaceae bacterium 26-R-25]|nr:hypothetical protein [Chitinophagaceae bacterium 26-R-25]